MLLSYLVYALYLQVKLKLLVVKDLESKLCLSTAMKIFMFC